MHSRLFALIAPLCLSIPLCLSTPLVAQQETPPAPAQPMQKDLSTRYQVYGGYSFLSNSLDGTPGYHQGLNGFDASFGFPTWHNLRFKIDLTSYRGTNLGAPQHPYFIMGGGQYGHRFHRETVFAEGLAGVGGANKTWATAGANGQTASFASFLGGGLDSALTHHVAFRIDGGFQYSYFALQNPKTFYPYRVPGLPTYFGRISSGVVYSF